MAFSLSPSVSVTETDLTTSITAAATNVSSAVGNFTWGPILQRTLLTDQDEGSTSLVSKFGKPIDDNYNDWFQCFNYLAYANALIGVRVVDDNARNAANDGASPTLIENFDKFEIKTNTLVSDGKKVIAKYAGAKGNGLRVYMTDANNYASWSAAKRSEFDYDPENNEFAVLVELDGNIVERFLVDRDKGSKDISGITTYYFERINRYSEYIWIIKDHATSIVHKTGDAYDAINDLDLQLSGGENGDEPSLAAYQFGADLLTSEEIDIKTTIQTGGTASSEAFGKYLIENVAEFRHDVQAVTGPALTTVVGVSGAESREVTARNTYGSSSYGFWASNYKYQYDKYNDTYRWVSFCGDVAGLMAAAAEDEPWQSPAGYDYGRIKNVERVAYTQGKPQRDILYKAQCNPIFIDGSDGCILLGDKTMQAKSSAFQYYNVRALFIVIEKAIATSSKYQLFKYNDSFTRLLFKNMVIPYLRNIQARRGILGSAVVCDERNNTDYVIGQGQFLASILVSPNRTIQGVGLNFVATSTGVDFEEITTALFDV